MPMKQQRRASWSSDDGSHPGSIDAPVLVYHESARSIVFRDHLRRAVQQQESNIFAEVEEEFNMRPTEDDSQRSNPSDSQLLNSNDPPNDPPTPNYIQPLPTLILGPNDEFNDLLQSCDPFTNNDPDWTDAEAHVVELLRHQQAVVKTLQNNEWTAFLRHFQQAQTRALHKDIPPCNEYHFNAFVTSTSLLPPLAQKMRAYGSTNTYTTGVVFGLPPKDNQDDFDVSPDGSTETWAWPAGYAAKTEFNIDGRGRLINGRREALVTLDTLRQYNHDYLTKKEYMVGLRKVSGLSVIPYNEVFLRVGGPGRLVRNTNVATGETQQPSLQRGVGLPIALFCRTATFGHLIALVRTRSRMLHAFPDDMVGIPLLYLDPVRGVRVLTEALQQKLWKHAANDLNPFQNANIAHKTTLSHTDNQSFAQKVDELLDLDESIQESLTPEELAHIAGGFGATDESLAKVLRDVLIQDQPGGHRLQDVVNEGLTAAVRAGDYHTSRQLLILYSLVASMQVVEVDTDVTTARKAAPKHSSISGLGSDVEGIKRDLELVSTNESHQVSTGIHAPPPPPPLDTDRLRSATNSDGLLAVLGAAQVLKAMQGGAQTRTLEAVAAVEEWVTFGEQNMAFRISSWYDQRAAQGDLKIATGDKTNFMAFVSNKAVTNRKQFASELRKAVHATDFTDVHFLQGIMEILSHMHSPCLRLELLQYVLGLDNRYSVAHVGRSIELAATCLGISLQRTTTTTTSA